MVEALTPNEQRVLDAIAAHFEQHSRMPTHAELAETLGFKSKNSSWQYLQQLQRKGYLHIDAYKSRGVMVSVPIVGHVACGKPVWAEADLEGYAQIDQRFIGANPNEFFLLRADGDSMNRATPAAIEDGDLLLVRHQADADSGEIVVARIDGEATVKYYKPSTGYAALLPRSSNPAHQPIIVTERFGIYGVVRRVFKRADLSL
jgi:repressor LexA